MTGQEEGGGRPGDAVDPAHDPGRTGKARFAAVLPRERIARELGALIGERKIFGAERNPDVLKKEGSGDSFLITAVPPMRRLLSTWDRLFGNRVLPAELLRHLAAEVHGFEHREAILLFDRKQLLYDCQIYEGDEAVGHLTLDLYRERDRIVPFLPFPTRPGRRVVYIEGISLTRQSTGYASSLFRRYERLFHDLGFHLFRLKASLSVGKYYWAKEGFDCSDRKQFREIRERLWDLVFRLDLPVAEQEVRRLTHMSDVAAFRRDIQIPAWRDKEGYYTLERDESHPEEFLFPLGKAFLLGSAPWDGHKVIYTDTPRRTALVWSEKYLSHGTPVGHPEGLKRLKALGEAIRQEGLLESLIVTEPYLPGMGAVHAVHDPAYLEAFREAAARGDRYFATRDCAIGAGSYETALLAAGGVMAGIDAVFSGRSDNAFCAVRPPGHHAGRDQAMGFCFVNNVAVGAAYARSAHGVARICILDWDAHHGNGTQDLFAEDPEVLFISLHEHPSFCYPGTGRRMDRGRGAGVGATLNVPLLPHAGDREMIDAFEREAVPAIEAFRPDLILLSAGFDAHAEDPITDLACTERAYVHMTRRVLELADRHCDGRVVSVLEGGYRIESFVASAIAHVKTLQGREDTPCSSDGE